MRALRCRFGDWNIKETDYLNTMQLISGKPAVYLVNLTEKAFTKKKSKWLPKVHEWVQQHGGEPVLPFSGKFESKIFEMPEDERQKYCKEVGQASCTSAWQEGNLEAPWMPMFEGFLVGQTSQHDVNPVSLSILFLHEAGNEETES